MNKTRTNRPYLGQPLVLGVVAACALGLVLPGCRSRAPRPPVGLVEIQRLSPVEATKGLTLDIWNSSGSVEVIVDPKATEPQVTARLVEPSGERRRTKDLTWVRPTLSREDGGTSTLKVVADPPRVEGMRSQLVVRIPATAGVKVVNAEGPVTLRGVTGPIDISNGSIGRAGGEISVSVRGAQTTPVTILNAGGAITFRAGEGTTGRFDIGTRDGEVLVSPGSASVRGALSGGSQWTGVLNEGQNPVLIRTGKGAASVEIQ